MMSFFLVCRYILKWRLGLRVWEYFGLLNYLGIIVIILERKFCFIFIFVFLIVNVLWDYLLG